MTTFKRFDALFRQTAYKAYADAGCSGKPDLDKMIVTLNYRGVRDVSFSEAVAELYLGEDQFFRVIDISIHPGLRDCATFFVRPSGHTPQGWDRTWAPGGAGPFKVMVPA